MTSSLEQCLLTKVHHSQALWGFFHFAHMHYWDFFFSFFFFFHRRPLSKDTLSTAVPLHVERWRCRVSAPVEQKLFYSPFSHKSTLFQTAVEDSFNIFLLLLARKNNHKYHSEADKNNNVRLKQEPCLNVWCVVAPHAPRCWKNRAIAWQ